ncbi:MAG: bifunctional 2-polyprenyl-6-hydroxyphenol methylase/3-demethylubiquinol 3-O-methyltransferase UbiG [Nostoc sp. DedQUE12b]|uniref:bifunctional 2-polyprenyl-6-hydroxyphenol methylase/3-demethylubiquinol 3-O-methyltransferase UbiG n=1 Tax=Nostoc sp. DedQUE12b TaxID=3075398 RepID=UPI002AD53E3D|nr:bifunctional 2-polyprenyl-6-hydroxyphenol methylase/3-demethylubiquinol 3-O-methyltransferase UbiG [Nostoc sp. DedQUE12b]MDZ8085869.1 bifunctional 2-polyprenyl-6-hydroxyphenol methylase/3-demethylubiquinol 3-O-methyltransferase UbiG [Nostoc sp. DedQUE12b]
MKRNNLEYYDLNADKWWNKDEILYVSNHLNKSKFEFFSNLVPDWKGLKVLDIGCGGGLACEFVANLNADVSGIDLSFNSIKIAQQHARLSNLKIDYQRALAENLPYQQNSFDVVLCFDVLEHVEDWKKVFSEAYRVLKQDGLFLFDTINRNFKSKFIMIWLLEDTLKHIPPGLHDWNKFIKPKEMIEVMKSTGFADFEIKGFDLTGESSFKTLRSILLKGLNNQIKGEKAELFEIKINNDTSVCYIDKAVKIS